MTVDAVYPRLSNTLREVLNMVHEENERFLGCPPVLEHFGGIHLVALVILQLCDVKMMYRWSCRRRAMKQMEKMFL